MPEFNVPEFTVPVMMRCHEPAGPSPLAVCGAFAGWMRSAPGELAPAYFCDAHRQRGDVPIAESYVFRRVSIEARLLIASASRHPSAGQVEAIGMLDRVLGLAGVVPDWLGVRSTIGRFTVRPGVGRAGRFGVGG